MHQRTKRYSWLLIQTKAKQEEIAKLNLENQKYKTFLPYIIFPHSKDESLQRQIMFPGYIFIFVDPKKDNLSPVRSTKGVLGFVRFGESFAVVQNRTMKSLMSRCDDESTLKVDYEILDFKRDDIVKIKGGQLNGMKAKFVSKRSEDRVRILLTSSKQNLVLELPESSLEKKIRLNPSF